MQKSFECLEDQLRGISSLGIRSASLIDTVKADCYGNKTEIQHIAQIYKTKNGVLIEPYDKEMLKSIETACKETGYHAYVFSKKAVKVNLPPMTGEELENLKKKIKKISEETKIAIRNIRKKTRQGLAKEDLKNIDEELQKVTNEYVKAVDDLVKEKEKYISRKWENGR